MVVHIDLSLRENGVNVADRHSARHVAIRLTNKLERGHTYHNGNPITSIIFMHRAGMHWLRYNPEFSAIWNEVTRVILRGGQFWGIVFI